MSQAPSVPLPFRRDRDCPFDPAPEFSRLRAQAPVTQVTLPYAEEPAWLVTRYDDVRTVLADDRVSNTPQGSEPGPGDLLSLDGPEHRRLRRTLTGSFSVKRVAEMRPWIEQLVTDHLDAMQSKGPPADLVSDFALPIPSLVICRLLGVPADDQDLFQAYSNKLLDVTLPPQERGENYEALAVYMAGLVRGHRAVPGDNLLGEVVRKHGDSLTDEELVGISRLLLVAGHETTANMLGLGTLLLLQHPDQAALIRDSETAIRPAVDEMLRYLSVVSTSVPRYATEDLSVGGIHIKAGDEIQCSLMSANRDETQLEESSRFDIKRTPGAHSAFGHGLHQCLGQQLARLEMQVAFPALLRRFPGLRLDVPTEELHYREAAFVYGLRSLPLTW